jgi:hypothetical protein
MELEAGDLVFDSKGRPIGVIAEVTDDAFVSLRRATVTLPKGFSVGPRPHPPLDLKPMDCFEKGGP